MLDTEDTEMKGAAPALKLCTAQQEAAIRAGENQARILILTLYLTNCINVDKAFVSFIFHTYKMGIIALLHKVNAIINKMKYST